MLSFNSIFKNLKVYRGLCGIFFLSLMMLLIGESLDFTDLIVYNGVRPHLNL